MGCKQLKAKIRQQLQSIKAQVDIGRKCQDKYIAYEVKASITIICPFYHKT